MDKTYVILGKENASIVTMVIHNFSQLNDLDILEGYALTSHKIGEDISLTFVRESTNDRLNYINVIEILKEGGYEKITE